MKKTCKFLLTAAAVSLVLPTASYAQNQEDTSFALEEVIVTGRKREESLTDVPISISVLNAEFIRDAGIVDQKDLFELTPGIFYDEQIDRLSQSPSVRGVQSSEIATNRTKVSSFIDGMPVLGAPASIAIGSTRQVEIYRGPQSAAFGRSTFGGAINYISPDPSEEFEGSLSVDVNDYGRRIINGQISSPINDKLGFLISAEVEDSTAPDEFKSNEGIQYGERSGESLGGKLVYNPSDNLEIELGFSKSNTEDAAQAEYFITQAARDACFDGTTSVGMGTNISSSGVFNCDWSQGANIATQADRVANVQAFYADPANAGALAALTGTVNPLTGNNYTLDDVLFLAEANSLPLNRFGAFDERDRTTLQIDYSLDNGSLLQFSAFSGSEDYIREYETSQSVNGVFDIAVDGMTGFLQIDPAMGEVGTFMSDPTFIDETYAELRWVSPSDQRLRWVAGASYYKTDFLTLVFGEGYSAVLAGAADIARYDDLVGNTGTVNSVGNAGATLGEQTENKGVFANLTYDFTEALTVTLEARYQVDDVFASEASTNSRIDVSTKALLPRLSFNYNANDKQSIYGQVALGNNPGGVNAGLLNPDVRETLNNGIDDGLDADGDGDPRSIYVDYTASDIEAFEEEELLQFEIGTKGAAFDNRLQYSAAIYKIFWENEALTTNLDFRAAGAMGMAGLTEGARGAINNGDKETQGFEFEGTYFVNDSFNLRGTFSYLDSEYVDYCDITNIGNDPLIGLTGTQRSTDPTYGSCVVISGNTVSQQPEFSGSLSPSYTTELNNGMSLNVRGDIRYQGKQYLDFFNVSELPATTTVNVSTSLRTDKWNVALYVNNLLDDDTPRRIDGGDDYSITTDTLPADSGLDFNRNILVTPSTQRTVGLRLNYNF